MLAQQWPLAARVGQPGTAVDILIACAVHRWCRREELHHGGVAEPQASGTKSVALLGA
jgi:hypothetical protein